jgi:hypothetical protein
MDWGIIAESIFFMAIALLAVVVTIFVFSASLLGRAVEAYKQQKKSLLQQQLDYLNLQVSMAEEQIKRFKSSDESSLKEKDKDMRALKEAIKQRKKFNKDSSNIESGFKVFQVSGGVIYPSCFFLSSILFSSLAWGIAATDKSSFKIGVWGFQSIPFIDAFVILAIIFIGLGIYRIYFSLRNIQNVAITSEEAALKRYIEAFKVAQIELEKEHKPELYVKLIEPQLPFKVKHGENFDIELRIGLSRGEVARQTSAVIAILKEFELVDGVAWKRFKATDYPDHQGYSSLKAWDILGSVWHASYATIKCPMKTGKYTFWYWAFCEGCKVKDISFQVDVV